MRQRLNHALLPVLASRKVFPNSPPVRREIYCLQYREHGEIDGLYHCFSCSLRLGETGQVSCLRYSLLSSGGSVPFSCRLSLPFRFVKSAFDCATVRPRQQAVHLCPVSIRRVTLDVEFFPPTPSSTTRRPEPEDTGNPASVPLLLISFSMRWAVPSS